MSLIGKVFLHLYLSVHEGEIEALKLTAVDLAVAGSFPFYSG